METDGRELLGQPAAGTSGRTDGAVTDRVVHRGILQFEFSFNLMKTSWVIIALAGLSATTVPALDTPYAVVERGANHRTWERTLYEKRPDGTIIPHIRGYTELATGMHF
jgi:hypothetical protein